MCSHEFKQHGIITHPSADLPWSYDIFVNNLEVYIVKSEETLEFDIVNIDCSFANALRRIMIAEVSSVAIERVYLQQNTSVMPDEVFCHRLGLIPLAVDPKTLAFPSKSLPETDDITAFNPSEHFVFDLHVKFTKADAKLLLKKKPNDDSASIMRSIPVHSSELKWVPLPGQLECYSDEASMPNVVSTDILLNKLAVGDEIEARCLAVRGIGRDHAKFSPVSATYYKFLPFIKLLRPVEGDLAKKLQQCFAKGVIGVNSETHEAFVENARLDNGSREHMRHSEFGEDVITVGVDSTHCVFTVESIAPLQRPPEKIVLAALDVMWRKCHHYLAIMATPGFSTAVGSSDSSSLPKNNNTSDSVGIRSQLNGRQVGLEVTHQSPDQRRCTFTFFGEDHTLGSALRFCVLRSNRASFCGYCVPHPLEDKINFDIQTKCGPAVDVLRDSLQCLLDCFKHIKVVFKTALQNYHEESKRGSEE